MQGSLVVFTELSEWLPGVVKNDFPQVLKYMSLHIYVCDMCGYPGHWMSQQVVLKSGVNSLVFGLWVVFQG